MKEPKPVSVAYRETKVKLAEILNNSFLPIDMVVSILENFLTQATMQAEKAYQEDLKKMQKKDKETEVKESD